MSKTDIHPLDNYLQLIPSYLVKMDVKELIKWLFQVNKSSTSSTNSRNSVNKTNIFVPLIVFIILNTVNICNCEERASNLSSDGISRGVTMNNKQNENKTVTYEPLTSADSKSEIDSTQSEFKTFHIDEKMREKLEAASGILRKLRVFNSFLDQKSEEYVGKDAARTFGRPIKKLQAMMIPLMFKLGVLSTIILLTFLLALKAVVIGKILMMLSSASLLASLAKLFLSKGSNGHDDLGKQVHLHIHNSGMQHGGTWSSSYSYPISGVPHSGPESWNRRQEPYIADHHNFFHHTGLGALVINTPYGRYVRTGAPTGTGFSR